MPSAMNFPGCSPQAEHQGRKVDKSFRQKLATKVLGQALGCEIGGADGRSPLFFFLPQRPQRSQRGKRAELRQQTLPPHCFLPLELFSSSVSLCDLCGKKSGSRKAARRGFPAARRTAKAQP